MRMTTFTIGVALAIAAPAAAQPQASASVAVAQGGGGEWEEFAAPRDGFSIVFPGTPAVTDATWTSQMNYTLPARVYTATKGREKYIVTVVDYSGIEKLGIERAKTCPPGNANCRPNPPPHIGPAFSRHDERSALVYATRKLLQRGSTLTDLAWEWQGMVEGHSVHLINSDKSRTLAYVAMHEHRLYIVEGTVPDGYPEPAIFQQALSFIDAEGRNVRYQVVYSNAYHGMGVYPKPTPGADGGRGAGAPAAPGGATPAGGRGAGY